MEVSTPEYNRLSSNSNISEIVVVKLGDKNLNSNVDIFTRSRDYNYNNNININNECKYVKCGSNFYKEIYKTCIDKCNQWSYYEDGQTACLSFLFCCLTDVMVVKTWLRNIFLNKE